MQSVQFHENGSRHQAQVRKRLDEIRRKGSASDRQAREELQILQKMEAAAMADYMGKDVAGAHNDLTSKVFADKKKERDKEKADIEAKAKEAMEKAAASAAAPPGPSSTPESSSDGSRSIGPVMLNPIAAPKQGKSSHYRYLMEIFFCAEIFDCSVSTVQCLLRVVVVVLVVVGKKFKIEA